MKNIDANLVLWHVNTLRNANIKLSKSHAELYKACENCWMTHQPSNQNEAGVRNEFNNVANVTQSTESTFQSVTSSRTSLTGNNQGANTTQSVQGSDDDVRAVIEDAEHTIREEGNFQTMGDTTFWKKVYEPKASSGDKLRST